MPQTSKRRRPRPWRPPSPRDAKGRGRRNGLLPVDHAVDGLRPRLGLHRASDPAPVRDRVVPPARSRPRTPRHATHSTPPDRPPVRTGRPSPLRRLPARGRAGPPWRARRRFARKGLDQVTIREVATRARTSVSTVHATYKSKDGPLRALMQGALFGPPFRSARAGVRAPALREAGSARAAVVPGRQGPERAVVRPGAPHPVEAHQPSGLHDAGGRRGLDARSLSGLAVVRPSGRAGRATPVGAALPVTADLSAAGACHPRPAS
jgi:AcrR family transcriptional regulator